MNILILGDAKDAHAAHIHFALTQASATVFGDRQGIHVGVDSN
ncbi:hypothetical protein [Brasilonema sp. UFV-L1]|nr:hypothetical protein [Brasilonema sp. UFV-L1]